MSVELSFGVNGAAYRWLLAHGENVLTGDSFFHLNALGEPLPGLNLCGAAKLTCCVGPQGNFYPADATREEVDKWITGLTGLAHAQAGLSLEDRVRQCAGCHGADGNSTIAGTPSLAGQ